MEFSDSPGYGVFSRTDQVSFLTMQSFETTPGSVEDATNITLLDYQTNPLMDAYQDFNDSQIGGDPSYYYNRTRGRARAFMAFYDQLIQHSYWKMRGDISLYVSPTVIVLGDISNLLALLVLRRKQLCTISACFYLSAYTIANLLVLNLLQGAAWLCQILEKPYINALADWTCRLWMFLSNVMAVSGVWFVLMLNVDRLVFTCCKPRVRSFCTVFTAKMMTVFILVGLVVINIHAMWTFELLRQGCYIPPIHDLHTKLWSYWSTTVHTYLPLLLIFALGLSLAISACREPRQNRHRVQRSLTPPGGDTDHFVYVSIVLSLAYFLLTGPTIVLNLVDMNVPSEWLQIDIIARLELIKKIAETFSVVNQGILFPVLLVCSRSFRSEFCYLFRCCAHSTLTKVHEMKDIAKTSSSSRSLLHIDSSRAHLNVSYEPCSNHENLASATTNV